MAKLPLTRKGLILFVGWFVVAIIILATAYLRMRQAKTDLAEYESARSCPTQQNCRQKIQATILQSGALNLSFLSVPIYYLVPSQESTYSILVEAPLIGKEEVKISSDPPYNETPFDVGPVYAPTGLDQNFVEENFYENRIVHVEVWRNKITLVYLNGIVDTPYNLSSASQAPSTKTIITSEPSSNADEVALPTTLHPIFQEAQEEKNFYGLVAICIFLSFMLPTFPLLFGLDTDIFWHRANNKKKKINSKPH